MRGAAFHLSRTVLILGFILPLLVLSSDASGNEKNSSDMSLDMGLTRDGTIHLWPLVKYSNNEETDSRSLDLFFSLYRYNRDGKRQRRHSHLIPLWWNSSSLEGKDVRALSLFYPSAVHYVSRTLTQTWSFRFLELLPHISALTISGSKDGQFVQNNALLLFWYKNDRVNDNRYCVFFPLLWHFGRGEYSRTSVFPLWWSGTNDSLRTAADGGPGVRRYGVLFPMLWYLEGRYRSFTVPPVFSHGKSLVDSSSYTMVTPLAWHTRKTEHTRTVAFPLWYGGRDTTAADTSRFGVLFPLLWTRQGIERGHAVLFPALWYLRNGSRRSYALPPLFAHSIDSDEDSSSCTMVTPLLWHTRRPGRTRTVAFPLWYRGRDTTATDTSRYATLFPLLWSRHSAFSQRSSTVFFPILWHSRSPSRRSFTLAPLYSSALDTRDSSGYTMVTPLVWHTRRPGRTRTTALPLWYSGRDTTEADTTRFGVLFPLVWNHQSAMRRNTVLFPLLWHSRTPYRRSFTLAPLYSGAFDYQDSSGHTMVTPLLWHTRRPGRSRTAALPLWYGGRDTTAIDTSRFGFQFPFVWHSRSSFHRAFTLAPFYSGAWNERTGSGHTMVTPLAWHIRRPGQSRTAALPLWYSGRDTTAADTSRFGVSFPIPLLWLYRSQNRSAFTLAPFYSGARDIRNGTGHTMITPLAWHTRRRGRTRTVGFPLWYGGRDTTAADTSRYGVLFPLLWHNHSPSRRAFTLAPFYSGARDIRDGTGHTMVTPLVWHTRRHGRTRTVGFPLWYGGRDTTAADTSRYGVLFPFVWHNRSSYQRAFTLAPFYSGAWNERTGSGHTMVTPLAWHTRRRGRTRTVGFPLWYGGRDTTAADTSRFGVLFPLVWSVQNTEQKTFAIPPLLTHVWKAEDSSSVTVALPPLFWRFSSPFRTRTRLFPLVGYYSDATARVKFDVCYFLLRYQRKDGVRSTSLLWPLIAATRGNEYRQLRLFPILWHKRQGNEGYTSVFPLFLSLRKAEYESFNLLFLLYAHRHTYGTVVTNGILWKLLYWERWENGDYQTRFLYYLYANVNKGGRREFALFPFVHRLDSPDGSELRSAACYWYVRIKRRIPDTEEYYREERIFWFIRLRSNYSSLKKRGVIKSRRDL